MELTKEEKKFLIDMICHKQTKMIVKDPTSYTSAFYRALEAVKIKIKDERGGI